MDNIEHYYVTGSSMSISVGGGTVLANSTLSMDVLFGGKAVQLTGDIAVSDFPSAATHGVTIQMPASSVPFTISGIQCGGYVTLHPKLSVLEGVLAFLDSSTNQIRFHNRNYTSGLAGTDLYVRFCVAGVIFKNN